jgi:hypothetical protein
VKCGSRARLMACDNIFIAIGVVIPCLMQNQQSLSSIVSVSPLAHSNSHRHDSHAEPLVQCTCFGRKAAAKDKGHTNSYQSKSTDVLGNRFSRGGSKCLSSLWRWQIVPEVGLKVNKHPTGAWFSCITPRTRLRVCEENCGREEV